MAKMTEYTPVQDDAAGNLKVDTKQPDAEVLIPKQDPVASNKELEAKERERRRNVKRSGSAKGGDGFRKYLSDKDRARAEQLCKEVGRPAAEGWLAIHIPDFDNASHEGNARKPDPIEAMTEAVNKLVAVTTKDTPAKKAPAKK